MQNIAKLARAIDAVNGTVGRYVAWLAVVMVLVQFTVVVLRYVFGIGSLFMQESIVYMHSLLFLLGAGYTLLHNGHVRVDIFYRTAKPPSQAKVDLFGSLFLLIPVCATIWWTSFPYVWNSWAHFEGSKETSGIPLVFLLKTAILIFCALMIAQAISMIIHSILVLTGHEAPSDEEIERV
ncbi:2,3-diketo-L-gulonate TRAP transporter small permease protein YiaM [Oceanibacterium hippocampi]|uniref:TRAP transporter small permease protein n=1 Tax=Oceanibacterium hippocampi TaxID=745714 RepID=A0A1Y5SSQ8_9PROT|nr:TRAP transporter small permease subunit [Oceanibacterium hippocampi]SLN44392.1 2,3-diketo-L-gulonate TRAP transporter small permease protein YiaM [Oceanibacterium hippocampi]